jgi:hypothetical protein
MTSGSGGRRLPWTAYIVVAVMLNIARQIVFPPSEVGRGTTLALALAVVAIAVVLVEVWRRAVSGAGARGGVDRQS